MYFLKLLVPIRLLVPGLAEPEKEFGSWGSVQFSFRPGFPERVSARLENLLEKENSWQIYQGLSSLLPRLSLACFGVLVILGAILIYMNGGLDANAILGTEKIDETNFISYLIFQK